LQSIRRYMCSVTVVGHNAVINQSKGSLSYSILPQLFSWFSGRFDACACVQETGKLFEDVVSFVLYKSWEETKTLIARLLDCEVVETVQKMWKRYLSPELLEHNGELPAHIRSSLHVICTFIITALGNKVSYPACMGAIPPIKNTRARVSFHPSMF